MKSRSLARGLAAAGLLLTAAAKDIACSADSQCALGCCSESSGSPICGYGPDYCGADNCIADASQDGTCDQKSECDPGYYPGWGTTWGTDYANETICPLNVCCSKYGFCGTTTDFCGDTTVTQPSCSDASSSSARNVGYYEGWSQDRACDVMMPEDIPIGGYTHLNFAFIYIDPDTFTLTPMKDNQVDLYSRFSALKERQSGLETWFSIGGWDFNDVGSTATTFSDLVASTTAQDAFFASVYEYLTEYNFDGVDIDWEYPVTSDRSGSAADYDNYVTFLQNFKAYLNEKGSYGLSITLPSSYWYMQEFDIVNISTSIDWFNVMTYDLHGTWDSAADQIGSIVQAHTNLTEIRQTMDLLWRNDIDPSQVSMGFGFYGRSFTLSDASCSETGCPFSGGGTAGSCTATSGILSYTEIEAILADPDQNAVMTLDSVAAVQIVTFGTDQWVSFDNAASFALKTAYANEECLGGTMVWAVSQDIDGAAVEALKNISSSDAFTSGGNNGTGDIYIDPSLWTNATQSAVCDAPCTFVLPPYPLETASTITWPDYVTSIASSSDGTVYTKTTTITIPEFTITEIPFWAVTVVSGNTVTTTFTVEQSIEPPSLTLTLPPTEATFPVISTDYTSLLENPTTASTASAGTITTVSTSVSTPAAVQTGMVSNCNEFYYSVSGDGCESVAEAYDISDAQFIAWNPAVGSECTNFWISEYYCVGVSSGTPVATPAAVQSGVVSDCTEFYESVDGDGCVSVAEAYDITEAQFISWNPAVGTDCTNFWISEYYCVAVASSTSVAAASSTTAAVVFVTSSHAITILPQATAISVDPPNPIPPITYSDTGGDGGGNNGGCTSGCGSHDCEIFGCGGACGIFGCDGGCGLNFCGGGCGLGGCGPGCGEGSCVDGSSGGGGGGDETATTTSTSSECSTITVTDYWVSCASGTSCTTTSSAIVSGCQVTATATTTGEYCPTGTLDPDTDDEGDDGASTDVGVTVTVTLSETVWIGGTGYPITDGSLTMGDGTYSVPDVTAISTITFDGTAGTVIPTRTGASISITVANITVIEVSSTATTTSAAFCVIGQDPDSSSDDFCSCSGALSNLPTLTGSNSPCGYTALPTETSTTTKKATTTTNPWPVTVTDGYGDVFVCASSTLAVYAGETVTQCAGSTSEILTVTPSATPTPCVQAHNYLNNCVFDGDILSGSVFEDGVEVCKGGAGKTLASSETEFCIDGCDDGYSYCATDNGRSANFTNPDGYTVILADTSTQFSTFYCGSTLSSEIKGTEWESCVSNSVDSCSDYDSCSLCDYRDFC